MEDAKDAEVCSEQIEVAKQSANGSGRAGDVNLVDGEGNIRRIPIPSDDPNDPLNFNKWRKLGILVSCCWFSIFSLVLVGGIGPIIPVFLEMYPGKSVTDVVGLSTYPSVTMACGAFVILPLAMMFGRRPVFLGCCLLLIGSSIGAAKSTSFDQHMACRVLIGVATGATESVLPLIITDVSFVDERGKWFAWYWGTQNLINAVFTISISYLVAATSWQWFYWVITILAGAGTVVAFFLLPETRYQRSPMSLNGLVVYTDEFGVTLVLTDAEARSRFGTVHAHNEATAVRERDGFIKQLKPYTSMAPNALQVGMGSLWKMVQCCTSPAVIWAILAASISLGVGIAMSLNYGTILTHDYGWSQSSVGLINVPIFPASIAAMVYAGWFGDKLNILIAKRRGGIHIPEDTLLILIFPAIVSMIGIIIYGAAAKWPETISVWGIIMGWALFEFGFIVVLMTTTHFASEAMPENPGPALVLVTGLKNVVSFGASYGITPMVMQFDYLRAYMILLGVFAAIFLLGIPIYLLNPKWRAYMGRKQHHD
ncbi:MFS general substrate transporter [Aaosphaeria arxii CBS 175.79]|uniref:MFS general substrate transporter n=1 Tax=Aaosphaeria arxii CBS 175.79 TaxID=1450172 RepID=A0A6A5XNH8_9PLEO|nr:MFS general substrate transporter [Aaosphaeria arxii CBS 175.79]KAF2014449.1 MFS general substrate transporter [Aaosphaeria arxii CBS 175.79]